MLEHDGLSAFYGLYALIALVLLWIFYAELVCKYLLTQISV
jgi:hypothetical protein